MPAATPNQPPRLSALHHEALFSLWQRLAAFPASETDAALRYLQEWISTQISADNVIWIGGIRVLSGAAARLDPFLGWRLRERVALRPDPPPYRQQLADYYNREHYGKLTPSYYKRSHETVKGDHVGMGSRASVAGAGRFRVHRMRDGWIDFAEFRRTSHYKRYYRDAGITDRIMIGFPVAAGHESFFLIDRLKGKSGSRRFTLAEATLVGAAVRGVPELHRYLFLGNGLLVGHKLFSTMERRILYNLLKGLTEKQIAIVTGQTVSTLHKYVTALYSRFGVKSRPALMAIWLGAK